MTDAGAAPSGAGTLRAGAQLGDRYTLTRLIGTGGMASVWAAQDPRLDREVAIKIISDTLALDPVFVDRFAREARIAAALSHPHVVGVFDFGTHGGRPYLVMELVAGGTLAGRLKDGHFDWDSGTLARELLDALSYIHEAGILHRDLKPANVLIGADGRARLTDFGIAHLADETKLTSTGFIVGTEKFLAPEVRRGEPATAGSDLFALGVVLRECTTASAPPVLDELADRLTDPDPGRRPRSAAAALAILDGTAQLPTTAPLAASGAGEPTAPMPVPGPETATRAMEVPAPTAASTAAEPTGVGSAWRRLPAGAAGLIAAAALGVVLLVLTLGDNDGGSEPLEEPPEGGTLTEQLNQLDDAIDRARR